MPELPEVQTVVDTLRPLILAKVIARVQLFRADIVRTQTPDLPQRLLGRTILDVARRGKKILIHLDRGILCIHLGMTGRLTVDDPATPLLPHTHLTVDLAPSHQSKIKNQKSKIPHLRFRDPRRFGGIWWHDDCSAAHANLGPEPLSLRPSELAHLLSRTRRPIKSALLDQSLIAGLGNIYVDESLFAARIHPLTPANSLTPDQIALLCRSIKRILRRAIAAGGSSLRDYVDATGRSGAFQKLHKVYGRESLPCPRCRSPIHRIIISGRSTHFCPQCQKSW